MVFCPPLNSRLHSGTGVLPGERGQSTQIDPDVHWVATAWTRCRQNAGMSSTKPGRACSGLFQRPVEDDQRVTVELVVTRLHHHLVDDLEVGVAADPAGNVLAQLFTVLRL